MWGGAAHRPEGPHNDYSATASDPGHAGPRRLRCVTSVTCLSACQQHHPQRRPTASPSSALREQLDMSSYLTFEEENAAWGTPESVGGTGDIIKDAMMKEKLIKFVHCTRIIIS